MRFMLLVLSIAVFGTAALAYAFRLDVRDQAQQAAHLNRQVERLLEEIEATPDNALLIKTELISSIATWPDHKRASRYLTSSWLLPANRSIPISSRWKIA